MKNLLIKLFLLISISLWILGFLLPLLWPESTITVYLYPFLSKIYSNVCHQDPTKLIEVNHSHSLVCYRCAGIYVGLFTGVILSFVIKKVLNLKTLIIVGSILLLDVISTTLGFYSYSGNLSFSTGMFFGISLFLYIQDIILKVFTKRNK